MRSSSQRYPELDIFRTVAVVMMILYHTAYDLEMFHGWQIGVLTGGWWLFARATAVIFLLLVGVSFSISWNRTPAYGKYFKRGAGLIAFGMLISAVTFVVDPDTYVRFGILHMIGVSILLIPFFARLKEWNALLGAFIISLGTVMPMTSAGRTPALLLVIGWMPPDFTSVDYWPLIPWFGVVLMGYATGHFIYVRRGKPLLPANRSSLTAGLAWPGRHALPIYLVHQPILLGILGLLAVLGIL